MTTVIILQKATLLVSYVSAFFVIANFLIKIAGYSETAWDWEFLFLIVDSIAVASLIYGVYSERAAFLQPFVVLSIVTTSFLILLGVYLASAVWNPNSYAGLDFELQLHKRFSVAAHKLPLEFKHVVSIVAAVGLIGILMSIVTHSWFIYLAVQCAKYFRMLDVKKGKEDP
ncbi:hypothetical protein Ddc_02935 [Ditylenchus destructor]|nr:hypothetical protein Ddc_02935 [Ditylenchus destructor]